MSNLERNRVILLKKIKYGEADLILHGLSVRGEKLSLLARGALKSKKRFSGGVLEPTHYLEVIYRHSKNPENHLSVLEEVNLIDGFDDLRSDYDKLTAALRLLETVSRVSQEGDHQSASLFNLTGHALKELQKVRSLPHFFAHFYLKFLYQQGVLEVENWMLPYLKVPMAEHLQLANAPIAPEHLSWLETQVESYLATAERHSF